MKCPVCGGASFEDAGSGMYRCTSTVITGAVPPGHGGNLGLSPIPIRGACGAVFSHADGVQAATAYAKKDARRRTRAQEGERLRRERAAADAETERRLESAWAALEAGGNQGLQPRLVPGRYYLSLLDRMLGRVGKDELVEVEGAWPIGTFSWYNPAGPHGGFLIEDLPSGYTPTGRVVPLEYGTAGDNVEMLYARRRLAKIDELWSDHVGDPKYPVVRQVRSEDIAQALERALAASSS